MKRSRSLIGIAIAGVTVVAVVLILSTSVRFAALGIAAAVSDRAAGVIARTLLHSDHAVQLAADDLNVTGGTNDGWSRWILMNSEKSISVQKATHAIVGDPHAKLGKRLAAADILWRRYADVDVFMRMLALVSPARSTPANRTIVANYRNMMAVSLSHLELTGVAEKFVVPADVALEIDQGSLERSLREAVAEYEVEAQKRSD